jgi:hypothetical protein
LRIILLAANDDVDQAGITEYIVKRTLGRNAATALADDDREFAFMMDFAIDQRR